MDTTQPLPLPPVDMGEELHRTVHHLCQMLRGVKRINPHGPGAAVSTQLEKHLRDLTPSAIGLPAVWEEHAARIEAQARADAAAEDGEQRTERTA